MEGTHAMQLEHNNSRYKDTTKGPLMILRTSVLTTLFLSVTILASTDAQRDREIQSRLSSILDKAGINFSGTFRSQYLRSMLDQSSGDSTIDWGKKQAEGNEYTSVDFDITARPHEALGARCMFRMHQNWQNFFSDVSNPIFLRWLSIDGNIKDMISFNVGNYRQRYSPLTLWSPDIEIAYEPEIFAQKRLEAMKEVFLGNNDRILQGINFNLDAEVVPIFNEFHLNAQAARLRLSEADRQDGSAVAGAFETNNTLMDRYLVAANLDLLLLKGLNVGGSFLDMFDLPSTYNDQSENPELFASQTAVGALRINPTTRIFLDSDIFVIGIRLEGAESWNRDSAWYEGADSTLKKRNKTGLALDVALQGSVKLGETGAIDVNIGFMNNEENFINDMAQSPTFLGQRIMNIENDWEHNARLYTTFDALYDHVFKFTPSANNSWTKEPRQKISYLNGILSDDEYEQVDGESVRFDSSLQYVLPFGAATPNRVGPKGDLSLKLFDGGIDAAVSFAILDEAVASSLSLVKTSFTKFGAGMSIDIATWAKVLNCMKFSFGYSLEGSENKGSGEIYAPVKFSSGFLNAGFYYNFWKRFSLLAGFQQIVSTKEEEFSRTITQSHWAAGLEYKVSEAQSVIGRVGQIGADFKGTSPADSTISDFNFKALQVEAFLQVGF